MRIEQLQYFVEIVNSGSISAASKKLFISPQGLSNALASLENEFGFQLFTREKNSLILTQNGTIVYQNASTLLSQYDTFTSLTKSLSEEQSHKKHISLLSTPLITPMLLKIDIYSIIPHDYVLTIHETAIGDIVLDLQHNSAQIGILFLLEDQLSATKKTILSEFELVHLFEDELCYGVHSTHPYAALEIIPDTAESMRVQYNPSYYSFFNVSSKETNIYTNNSSLHLFCMKNYNAIVTSTEKMFPYVYDDPEIICKSYNTEIKRGIFYLIHKKNINDKAFLTFVDTLKKYIVNRIS